MLKQIGLILLFSMTTPCLAQVAPPGNPIPPLLNTVCGLPDDDKIKCGTLPPTISSCSNTGACIRAIHNGQNGITFVWLCAPKFPFAFPFQDEYDPQYEVEFATVIPRSPLLGGKHYRRHNMECKVSYHCNAECELSWGLFRYCSKSNVSITSGFLEYHTPIDGPCPDKSTQ